MSAEMLQQLYLPRRQVPSSRDREIFELALEDGVSQGELAERYSLSQGRIAQIVQRVTDWVHSIVGEAGALPSTLCDVDRELTAGERLSLAERLAYERIEFVYGQALEAWRASQADATEVRTRQKGNEVIEERITKSQTGKAAYLYQAQRAALASARLMGVDVTGRARRKPIEQTFSATTNNHGEMRAEGKAEVSSNSSTYVAPTPATAVSIGHPVSSGAASAVGSDVTANNPDDSAANRVSGVSKEATPPEDDMLRQLQAYLAGSVDELLKSAA